MSAGFLPGTASNSQPYTLCELDAAGLSLDLFMPELAFWSFTHGFSKPDPHVCRLLGSRLQFLGIPVEATLMIGDRRDIDIEPALVQGWQASQLTATPDVHPGGD